MGKRIVSQARGHGSLTYRVRKKVYQYKIGYPPIGTEEKARIIKLINSAAHSAPLAKIKIEYGKKEIIFYNLAFDGAVEGQEIELGKEIKEGNIIALENAKQGTRVYNIEIKPGDGGKLVRSSGSFAEVIEKSKNMVKILMPSKKEIEFNEKCRATIGIVAGAGRLEKPIVKAGKKFHMMKSKGRKWHFTSKVKVNAVDHPFGGGRGKRIKSKIAKRNAPPGARVGHIRPRRTGREKK